MRKRLLAALGAVLIALPGLAAVPDLPSAALGAPDPFAWLEDIHGARAMAWVKAQNAKTAAVLETDPRFEVFRRQALTIFTAKDRIPTPGFLGGEVDNLWQDGDHTHGLWRETTVSQFDRSAPTWRTLIDLDALSKADGHSLFFKGAACLAPEDRYCLVRLSYGGGDAVEIREFDVKAGAFVADGFHFARAKQDAVWLDRDTVLLAGDFGPGTLTSSGYPSQVRRVSRGQDPSTAPVVFKGDATDVRVFPRVLRDADGKVAVTLIGRSPSFFSTRYLRLDRDGALTPLNLPFKTELHGYLDGRLIVQVNEPWAAGAHGAAIPQGSLAAVDPRTSASQLIFAPDARQALVSATVTRSRLIVEMLDNVDGEIRIFRPGARGWRFRTLALPDKSTLHVVAADHGSDRAFITSESFLEPTALWRVNAATSAATRIKGLSPKFDASGDVVEQRFAVSKDGTHVPYFLVRPKDMRLDGTTPVQMFGYGGFQLSETPTYRPEMGKLWLERGGAYVLTNIRGGGEFGPAWHEAALREHRQRAFDDFAAVAEDLIARHITSPPHLGIYARSNGGILTSVSITQHPELFGAAVIESPLIDMLRYSHLSAGASWMAEYGDPDIPADRAFIARYSAYTNLKPGVKYPEPYITTNTEDDRVHPGHARKFAAEMEALGDPVLFYENTFGGHAMDADADLQARRWARHYVYLSQKLMD